MNDGMGNRPLFIRQLPIHLWESPLVSYAPTESCAAPVNQNQSLQNGWPPGSFNFGSCERVKLLCGINPAILEAR